MTDVLHFDDETRSRTDLRAYGLDNYTRDFSFRVLMRAWAINDEPVNLWQPHLDAKMPVALEQALRDKSVVKSAWNNQFERRSVLANDKIVIPYESCECTMVKAMALSLPGKLEEAGKVLQLTDEHLKNRRGMALIRIFCVPHKPTKQFNQVDDHGDVWYGPETHPVEWDEFCAYCKQDVVSERRIDKIVSRHALPKNLKKIYALDQKINDRGVPIDLAFVDKCLALARRRRVELKREMVQLTGLVNPNSTEQLLPWLRERGYPFSNLRAATVRKAMIDFRDTMTPLAMVLCRLRLIAAMRSTDKFLSMKRRTASDGRLRFAFQMAGAGRTMRWAGRGVQLQNLARTRKDLAPFLNEIRAMIMTDDYEGIKAIFDDPLLVLSSMVRPAIAAKPGNKLVVADLNAIETRLIAFISGCPSLQAVFDNDRCPYKTFASEIYGKPYDQVTKDERSIAKPAVLGCGFMLSGGGEVGKYPETTKTGLWAYAEQYGVKLDKGEAAAQVKAFRDLYPEIKTTWGELSKAMMDAIENHRNAESFAVGPLVFDAQPPFVRMRLPSGRYVHYLRPRISEHKIYHPDGRYQDLPDEQTGEPGRKFFKKIGVSYEGKNLKGQWTRVTTHPGKQMENGAQAMAMDVLTEGLVRADDAGFNIIGHVHDEIIAEENELIADEGLLAYLCRLMALSMPWAPDLTLAAAGYIHPFYIKD